jgi:ribonuclease HI
VSEEFIDVFTDGSCEGNPGPGGWAALVRAGASEKVLSGGERASTNNRMELTAALRALQAIAPGRPVRIYTDSQYLRRGITEWLRGWELRGWKRKTGALANVDLWQELAGEIERHTVEWHWVKGHADHAENIKVDRLARAAMLQARRAA